MSVDRERLLAILEEFAAKRDVFLVPLIEETFVQNRDVDPSQVTASIAAALLGSTLAVLIGSSEYSRKQQLSTWVEDRARIRQDVINLLTDEGMDLIREHTKETLDRHMRPRLVKTDPESDKP